MFRENASSKYEKTRAFQQLLLGRATGILAATPVGKMWKKQGRRVL